MYGIAIDPGSGATAYVVFHEGKPVFWKTIWRKKKATREERLRHILIEIGKVFHEYSEKSESPVSIAIEDFEPSFHAKKDKFGNNDKRLSPQKQMADMCVCSGVQHAIYATAFQYTDDVRFVSKGKTSKWHSALRWKSMGITDDPMPDHITDAFEIGICAGFDKRLGRSLGK